MDPIYAEATPPGRGGVSVVRVSGEGARNLAETLVGPMADARHAYLRALTVSGEVIDHVLVMWFQAGASFTGEEVAELHLHGAPVIVRRVCRALSDLGARSAEAGEFTSRAFLNGRMDLAEIEGLGDLLAAETETQRKLALRTASGELGRTALRWRDMLTEAGALIEVSVDFADEDVPDEIPPRVFAIVDQLLGEIGCEIAGFAAAERVRTGFEVAVIGPPNAGKSSLINYLARRDVAIVSEIAGTTRDVIELRFDLRGLAVTFLDTAGLRETGDDVEAIGVMRAKKRAEAADLRVHLSRDGTPVVDLFRDGDLVVRSHVDLNEEQGGVSSVSGQGIDEMLDQIYDVLSSRVAGAGLVSHERQMAELVQALDALTGLNLVPVEIAAEALRLAAQALDRLVGKIDAEDYLDVIFSRFCIGK